MVDNDKIENYRAPETSIESVDGDLIQIYCADSLPPMGAAIAIEAGPEQSDKPRLYAMCQRHLGAHRLQAWLPMAPSWITAGLRAEPTDLAAGFSPPDTSALTPNPTIIHPLSTGDIPLWPEAPTWSELAGNSAALSLDIAAIDALAPVCRGGINLIIDTTSSAASSRRLTQTIYQKLSADTVLLCARSDGSGELDALDDAWRITPDGSLPSHIASLQLTIAMASRLREHPFGLTIVELPTFRSSPSESTSPPGKLPPQGLPEIIDRLGRHLVSTSTSSLTTVLLLHITDDLSGLGDIIDTLRLGDVDSTIIIDRDGRFAPQRSTSRAGLDDAATKQRKDYLQTLTLAGRAREKATLFGEQELSDAERRAVEACDDLRIQI